MKLTSVEIHSAGPDITVLSFRDPGRTNPYNVKTILGLDADDIAPRYYGGTGNTKFYNLSLEKREIVVIISLNPRFSLNESFSDLRDALYKMISSSRTGIVQLQFKNGVTAVAAISGFVSKFEAPQFTKTSEVQMTISCTDPMLKALTATDVDVSELDPLLTVIQDDLSTAPHGFLADIEFVANTPAFNIGDVDWSFEVIPVGGFLIGDVLHFSSEHNNKFLYLTRGINDIYLADVITPGSVWPVLFPGDSTFVCENPTTLEWNAISYYPTYWGV